VPLDTKELLHIVLSASYSPFENLYYTDPQRSVNRSHLGFIDFSVWYSRTGKRGDSIHVLDVL